MRQIEDNRTPLKINPIDHYQYHAEFQPLTIEQNHNAQWPIPTIPSYDRQTTPGPERMDINRIIQTKQINNINRPQFDLGKRFSTC